MSSFAVDEDWGHGKHTHTHYMHIYIHTYIHIKILEGRRSKSNVIVRSTKQNLPNDQVIIINYEMKNCIV